MHPHSVHPLRGQTIQREMEFAAKSGDGMPANLVYTHVDWRGRPEDPEKHGGRLAAVFVCVTEVFDNMVLVSNVLNLVSYFSLTMHYTLPESANMVTNFQGTGLILSLLAGVVCDAYLKRFWTVLLYGIIELLGLAILTVQAYSSKFRPLPLEKPSGSQAAMLYCGLYVMAIGISGIKAALPAHGGDQFVDKKQLANFFNWFYFSICVGGLLAVTGLVWIQENKGWQWGFLVCNCCLALGLIIFGFGLPYYRHKVPSGGPFTRIFKVLLSAFKCRGFPLPDGTFLQNSALENRFRFLDKVVHMGYSREEIEETKIFIRLLPILFSTVMMHCCLAQMGTFSVQQGRKMNTHLSKSFNIPTASLNVIPLIVMLLSVSLYDRFLLKHTRAVLTPLRRIGLGLLVASASMAAAAIIEAERKAMLPNQMSVAWLGWQYLLVGIAEMLTLEGMLEFFYSEAPDSMRSVCTTATWIAASVGFFLSSVLVTVANKVSSDLGSRPWLTGHDLNNSRLEWFYTMLSVLNFVIFLNYLLWARWY